MRVLRPPCPLTSNTWPSASRRNDVGAAAADFLEAAGMAAGLLARTGDGPPVVGM